MHMFEISGNMYLEICVSIYRASTYPHEVGVKLVQHSTFVFWRQLGGSKPKQIVEKLLRSR